MLSIQYVARIPHFVLPYAYTATRALIRHYYYPADALPLSLLRLLAWKGWWWTSIRASYIPHVQDLYDRKMEEWSTVERR